MELATYKILCVAQTVLCCWNNAPEKKVFNQNFWYLKWRFNCSIEWWSTSCYLFCQVASKFFFLTNWWRNKNSNLAGQKSRSFILMKEKCTKERHERKTNVISVRGHVLNIQLMSVDYIQLLMMFLTFKLAM